MHLKLLKVTCQKLDLLLNVADKQGATKLNQNWVPMIFWVVKGGPLLVS